MDAFPPPSGHPSGSPSDFVPVVNSTHPKRQKKHWMRLPLWGWIVVGVLTIGAIGAVAGKPKDQRPAAAGGAPTATVLSTTNWVTTVAPASTPPTTVPATTVAATTVAPTTVPPTTIAPTTVPPTTARPTTTEAALIDEDSYSDRMLSSLEYSVALNVLDQKGYDPVGRAELQNVGEAICTVAEQSSTQSEFLIALMAAIPSSMDQNFASSVVGIVGALMCKDEFVRLGFDY